MDKLLGLLSAVTTSGLVSTLIGIYFNRHQQYVDSITKTRSISNDEFRQNVACIVGFCRYYIETKEIWNNMISQKNSELKLDLIKLKLDFFKSLSIVKMKLSINPLKHGNEYHGELENILFSIENIYNIKDDSADKIEMYARFILDNDWKRIKNESKGVIV